ncbi:MAG: alpha/beta hydrolase [Chloroflexi bacterium]|nr:alpha/beta hydrolase [Chloroflexota bacterium]
MPSFQAKFIHAILQLQPYGWAKGTIHEQRLRQERSARLFRIPKGINLQQINIQGILAEWIACPNAKNGVILYLHGGAYALGSINVHREWLSRLALVTRLKVLAINYRLAPENPFPAALEDAVTAYRWLLAQGFAASDLVVAGDSAGGGLALSTLVSLRDAGDALPACLVCISPWVDLTLAGDSIHANAAVDPILNADILESYAKLYTGSSQTDNPLISPLFADLNGLPPVLIHAGTNEILLDDANCLFAAAQRAGVDVHLETWEGLFHVFQIVAFIPETKQSLDHISKFIMRNLTSR